MRDWLGTRGRAIISLLSDFGGALSFVVLAVALITAAVAGAILVAVDVFPPVFLAFLILGLALLAAGLALHFLREPMARSVRSSPATPTPPGTDESFEPDMDDAYARAVAAERRDNESKARRGLRQIREELRDNRAHVVRAGQGEIRRIQRISLQTWHEEENTLVELQDPAPHAAARHAYRELEGIQDVIYIRASRETFTIRRQPLDLLETDVQTTLEAIDEAIEKLTAAEAD